MAERGNSVFDKKDEKPSMVADILGIGKEILRGVGGAVTGVADLAVMTPTFAYKKAQGMPFSQAVQSSSGLLTNALGLEAPKPNTPESYLYKAGQFATPFGVPKNLKNYSKEVGVNVGLDAANTLLPENSGMTIPIAAGLLAGTTGVNAIRNKMIANKGFTPAAAAQAESRGLTLGQYTGNANALRAEERLASSPSQADAVKNFYTQQSDAFERSVKDVAASMERTTTNRQAARNTFDKLAEMYKNRKAAVSKKFGEDLDKFYEGVGGANRRFIPSNAMVDQIDDIIATTKASVGSTGNEVLIKEMEKIRGQLIDPKTQQPRKISAKEFKEQQSYWSKASFQPGSWIDGITADTAKPLAAKMNNAMDETLDAATTGYKNAKAMKAIKEFQVARQDYRVSLENMKDYAALPVNRLFDAERVSALKGEDIVTEISKYPPETLESTMKYLQEVNPEIVSSIRGQIMDNLVSKGVITGAAEQGAKFDSNAFLKAFDEAAKTNPSVMSVMFPDPIKRAEFQKNLLQARKIANSKEAASVAGSSPAVDAASDIASLSGGVKARVATRGAAGAIKDTLGSALISDKELFDMLFKNQDIRAGFLNSYNKGIIKEAGNEQTRAARQISEMEEAELQQMYMQHLAEKEGQTEQPQAPQSEAAPPPSMDITVTPMTPPQAPTMPSPETMSEQELQQLYLQHKGLQ